MPRESKVFSTWFREKQDLFIQDFLHVLNINTQAPNEWKIHSFLKEKLGKLGFYVEDQAFKTPNNFVCKNLFARYPKNKLKKNLTINCHLDTIPFPQLNTQKPYYQDGIFYGRGACDNKGNLIGLLWGLNFLMDKNIPIRYNLELDLVAAEEIGGYGSQNVRRTEKANQVWVLEPTENRLYLSARGCLPFIFYKKSSSKHIGVDTRGEIYQIARLLKSLQQLNHQLKKEHRKYSHHLQWKNCTGVHVTQIQAGEWHGATPEQTYIRGNIAFTPFHLIENLKERLITIGNLLNYKVTFKSVTYPFSNTIQFNESFVCASRAFQASCDAVFYHNRGEPTFIFGAGSLKQAHATNEYIRLKDLKKFIFLLTEHLKEF